MSLNSVLQKRKIKKAMETGDLQNFTFKTVLHNFIEKTVSEITNKKFKKQFSKLKDELEDKAMRKTDLYLKSIKAKDGEDGKSIKGDKGDSIKGDKGDDGDSPTKTFLSSLIRPLIPKPKVGKQGIKGESIKGDKGDSGSPDKPKEIVKKLNTLDNTLDVKVLKGLKPILKSIQDSIRSMKKGGGMGGGGVGNFIPEEFALTSATTTVTLQYNVASSSKFILVSYNGQLVSPNDANGYSISGKVITLGFTPADGTYLDVWYVRT